MRIGIDFDNTIACYDKLFPKIARKNGMISQDSAIGKAQTKIQVLSAQDGEINWQWLQGQVYGPYMHEAELFPGFIRFVIKSLNLGHEIFIVSHKTEYGHFDTTRTNLRTASLSWMEKLGFFSKTKLKLEFENVFFENTRLEKIQRIIDLKLDVMIDDLVDVLHHPHFPPIRKFLFGSSDKNDAENQRLGWGQISEAIFGKETEEDLLCFAKNSFVDGNITSFTELLGGRNSRVFHLEAEGGRNFAVKFYPDRNLDRRKRLRNEVLAVQFLESFQPELKLVHADPDLDICFFSWIDGVGINTPSDADVCKMLEFLAKIFVNSANVPFKLMPLATESCLCLTDILGQIDRRLSFFSSVNHPLLREVLEKAREVFAGVESLVYKNWPKDYIYSPLPSELLILSPSDFGFHNALKDSNGDIIFLDFEYFGWDDPVKLCIDMVLHPGMKLTAVQKNKIVKFFMETFSNDVTFEARFNSAWPLYCIRWALIMCNVFYSETVNNNALTDRYRGAMNFLALAQDEEMGSRYVE